MPGGVSRNKNAKLTAEFAEFCPIIETTDYCNVVTSPYVYACAFVKYYIGPIQLNEHHSKRNFLWSPYVIGQTIIFLPCNFYLRSFFLA